MHCSPQVAFINRILQLAPDTIKWQCGKVFKSKSLLLRDAILCGASYEVTTLLLDTYAEGAKVQMNDGSLPLHLACEENASDIACNLLEVYPDGAKVQNMLGNLPLHLALLVNATYIALKLLKVRLEGAKVQRMMEVCRYMMHAK
jgi:ankyrin repeat protein